MKLVNGPEVTPNIVSRKKREVSMNLNYLCLVYVVGNKI